jgi:hypothetical protein
VVLADLLTQREPDPSSRILIVTKQTFEDFNDPVGLGRIDADPVVGDGELPAATQRSRPRRSPRSVPAGRSGPVDYGLVVDRFELPVRLFDSSPVSRARSSVLETGSTPSFIGADHSSIRLELGLGP